MSQEMKNKLENLSRLYEAWNAIERVSENENEDDDSSGIVDTDYAQDMIDKVIISITQEVVELYRKSK